MFASKHSSNRKTLEKTVEGLMWRSDIQFEFSDGNGKVLTPVYVLPTDFVGGALYGFFTIDEKLVEAKIGFRQVKHFVSSQYYEVNSKGALEAVQPKSKVLYLPLKLTKFQCAIAKKEGGRVELKAGYSSPLFSVQKAQHPYPVLLYADTDSGGSFHGVCNDHGQPQLFVPTGRKFADDALGDLLKNFKKAPLAPKIVVRGKRSGSSVDAKSIDWTDHDSIIAFLDQYAVGQESAKETLADAFSAYLLKVKNDDDNIPVENVILIGPSGSGKTYMASLLAKAAGLPFADGKMTGKSAEGYIGHNLSRVFKQITAKTNSNVPYGVVFFDEIDKSAKGDSYGSFEYGPQLQDELIGWLDGTVVHGDETRKEINTGNLLFISAGAFHGTKGNGLEAIIRARLGAKKGSFGFSDRRGIAEEKKEAENVLFQVMPEDLVDYGIKPELIGRFPHIGVLKHLTVDDKVRILTGTKDSIVEKKRYLLKLAGYEMEIDSDVYGLIAERCPKETGARALRAVCNDLFKKIRRRPQEYAKDGVIRLTGDLAGSLITLYK